MLDPYTPSFGTDRHLLALLIFCNSEAMLMRYCNFCFLFSVVKLKLVTEYFVETMILVSNYEFVER